MSDTYSNRQINTTQEIIKTALDRKATKYYEAEESKINKKFNSARMTLAKEINKKITTFLKDVRKASKIITVNVSSPGYGSYKNKVNFIFNTPSGYRTYEDNNAPANIRKLRKEADTLIIRMKLGTALAKEVEDFVAKIDK